MIIISVSYLAAFFSLWFDQVNLKRISSIKKITLPLAIKKGQICQKAVCFLLILNMEFLTSIQICLNYLFISLKPSSSALNF